MVLIFVNRAEKQRKTAIFSDDCSMVFGMALVMPLSPNGRQITPQAVSVNAGIAATRPAALNARNTEVTDPNVGFAPIADIAV